MTYCDFKPGDEVERVQMGIGRHPEARNDGPPIGHVGRIVNIGSNSRGTVWIELDNWPIDPLCAPPAKHFRKVQRRDLSAWLETSTDFEEPKRSPAKESV